VHAKIRFSSLPTNIEVLKFRSTGYELWFVLYVSILYNKPTQTQTLHNT
jgi:hypothetical protein